MINQHAMMTRANLSLSIAHGFVGAILISLEIFARQRILRNVENWYPVLICLGAFWVFIGLLLLIPRLWAGRSAEIAQILNAVVSGFLCLLSLVLFVIPWFFFLTIWLICLLIANGLGALLSYLLIRTYFRDAVELKIIADSQNGS